MSNTPDQVSDSTLTPNQTAEQIAERPVLEHIRQFAEYDLARKEQKAAERKRRSLRRDRAAAAARALVQQLKAQLS